MKSMRIPLIIALGIAIIGIVFGSFFDLNISTAIASPSNAFGLTISAIGPTIGFAAVAAMGGGFIAFIVKGKYHIALKILFGVLAAGCFYVAIRFPAGEWFGVNGFYGAAPEKIGYLVVIVPEAAAAVGGYFLFKDCQNKNMWIIFCIIIGILGMVLVVIITTLKGTMHRPRYRLISTTDLVAFHNWWEPCKDYKELIATNGFNEDNFKSYPSGHTAETSILFVATVFLPLADNRFKKYQTPMLIFSSAMVLLVAFARILAAAHFLSDVSTGATIMLVCLFVANEVVMRIKQLQPNEETVENK